MLAGIVGPRGRATRLSVSAAGILLDHGWGKAVQPIAGEDGGRVDIRQIVDNIGEQMKVVGPVPRKLAPAIYRRNDGGQHLRRLFQLNNCSITIIDVG
jgi:hypothetical protein